MTEIEELKAQIKVLEKKLSFLEELEKTKSPVEEAYKDWWGEYPETGTWDSFDKRWQGFQAGYEFAYEEKVEEEPEELKTLYQRLVEVIDENGRSYVNFEDNNDVSISYQDDGRTLKVFVNKVKPKPQTLFDVIRNLGYSVDCSWEIVDAVEAFQKSKENEQGTWNYDPDAKFRKQEEVKKLQEKEWSYKITDEHGETNPYLQYLNSVEDEKKIEELGFVKNSDGNWTAQPLGETSQEQIKKLQEKDWEIKVETDYLTGKARHKTKIVDKDGNDYQPKPHTTEELLKPNWEPTPQTPEQVEEGLRNAMRTAIKEGIIPEIKEPTDELIDKLTKNPPEFLKFELGETLYDVCMTWWGRVFDNNDDMETCISDLVDNIDYWLPREQDASGSQNTYAVAAVEGYNDCLNKIRRKLR